MEAEARNQSPREETQNLVNSDTADVKNETKPKKKIPSLDDTYEHAPPSPDGDPWMILLKPEMEKDKIQCDAWKEEVQTLLIFAGLFSAVVTAFIVESYKFLQPDPNDTIISLLTQIANGPNTTTSSPLSADGSLRGIAFTQKASSVRINVFWFLSLILSLATVLIGTIALQWLREHQAYPGLSPKQTLALLRVRTEALQAWFVPQIFSALPLLLQGALVLFLAGLIDFTLPLGLKLVLPIALIIGLILLFLAATTVLPALQALLLLFNHLSRDTVPSPCAFKSPQSQLFRALSGIFLYSLTYVFPKFHPRNGPTIIYNIWRRKSWSAFDLDWLFLRDAWHDRILRKDEELYSYQMYQEDYFPLSDITQCLIKIANEPFNAERTQEFLVAAYYCFHELSESIWKFKESNQSRQVARQNYYFEQLYRSIHTEDARMSVATFLLHGGSYKPTTYTDHELIEQHCTLFCQDQTYLFRARLLQTYRSQVLESYHEEVQLRMIQHLLQSNFQCEPLSHPPEPDHYEWVAPPAILPSPSDVGEDEFQKDNMSYWVDLFATLIDNTAFSNTQARITNPLYTHEFIVGILGGIALQILSCLELLSDGDQATPNLAAYGQPHIHQISAKYGLLFRSAADYLNEEIRINTGSRTLPNPPSILFFHSAYIIEGLLARLRSDRLVPHLHIAENRNLKEGISALVHALAEYKKQTGSDLGSYAVAKWAWSGRTKIDTGLRTRSKTRLFSERYWASLFYAYACCYDFEVDPDTLEVLQSDPQDEGDFPVVRPGEPDGITYH